MANSSGSSNSTPYTEHNVPIVFFGYQTNKPPIDIRDPTIGSNLVSIPKELISTGHIDQDELSKSFADMALSTVKALPAKVQDTVIQTILPDFNAVVDPERFGLIPNATAEFEIIAKKCNMWASPLVSGKNLITTVRIPVVKNAPINVVVDPTIVFSTLSNLKKHSAMICQVRTITGSKEDYVGDTTVVMISQLSMDVEILTNVIEVLDLMAFQLTTLHGTIFKENANPKNVKENKTIQTEFHNIRLFLQNQLKTLKMKTGEFKQKRNQRYYENILLPKFETLLENWGLMLGTERFLRGQTVWGNRVAQREAHLKSLQDVLINRTYFPLGSVIENDITLAKTANHATVITNAILHPGFPDSVGFLGKHQNPFDPIFQLSKDNLLVATLMWPELAVLLRETNSVIGKTVKHLRRLEKETARLATCEIFWIKDGVLQPQSLIQSKKYVETNCVYQVPESNLLVYLAGSRVTLYSFGQGAWLTWNVAIKIPDDFDVIQIIAKQSWLVIQLGLRNLDKDDELTNGYNKIGYKEKLAYIAVFNLDYANRIVHHHFTLPSANIIHMGFSEDHSFFAMTPEDKSAIDDSLYCILRTLDVYQISLRQKSFRWVTAIISDDKTITMATASRLKKVIFKTSSYTLLTNNDVIIMGPMVSNPIRTKDDETMELPTQKLSFIAVQPERGVPILDIAEQGHIIAVAHGNGTVTILDKEEGVCKNVLEPPKGGHPKERALFHVNEGLSNIVFNSNEEILFYNNKGACLSWKLNIPQ
jgi:hypothetical protein